MEPKNWRFACVIVSCIVGALVFAFASMLEGVPRPQSHWLKILLFKTEKMSHYPLYTVYSKNHIFKNVFSISLDQNLRERVNEIAQAVVKHHFNHLRVEIVIVKNNEKPPAELITTLSTHYDRVLIVDWKPASLANAYYKNSDYYHDGKEEDNDEDDDDDARSKLYNLEDEEDEYRRRSSF